MEITSKQIKQHNFSAGPAILPQSVINQAADAIRNFNGTGLSILEISHRSPEFIEVLTESNLLIRKLLKLPEDFEILFLSGGASSQFFMTAMNLLDQDAKACYVDTGTWASKAIKEAKLFGHIDVLASSKDRNYSYIPKTYKVPEDAVYLHLTSNNTIFGTEYHWWPETNIPIVCDMSSDIFSRPIDVEKYGLIYAGAQKNLGPAGTTLVLLRKGISGKVNRSIPTILQYKTHIDNQSLFNTPPVYAIYVCMLTLKWLDELGGLEAMERLNKEKAALLYREIDNSPCFEGTAAKEDRSLMNVTFVAKTPEMESAFLKMCNENGCVGLKGHRSVGGFRASIYNAMPIESVQTLVKIMQRFAEKHG